MFINFRELPSGHRIDADLCIVGGGAAGITLASQLDRSGLSVCLLESGSFEFDPAPQKLCEGEYAGEVPSLDAGYLTESRRRVFGGTTSIWAGYVRPLEPIDFDTWSRALGGSAALDAELGGLELSIGPDLGLRDEGDDTPLGDDGSDDPLFGDDFDDRLYDADGNLPFVCFSPADPWRHPRR